MRLRLLALALLALPLGCVQPPKVLSVSTLLEQLPFLQAKTTRGDFLFLVDTGCSQTWVSEEFIRVMDLPAAAMEPSSIAYPAAERQITSSKRLSGEVSGDLPIALSGAYVVDTSVAEEYARQWENLVAGGKDRFAGVVGLDALTSTKLVFSPHSFRIASSNESLPPPATPLVTLPLQLSGGLARLGFGREKLSHPPVVIDTGTAQDLVTLQPAGTAEILPSSATTIVNGREWQRVRAPRWDQGEEVLPSLSFWISVDSRPIFLLGTAFLREFAVTIDFSSQTLLVSERRADYAPNALLNAYY